MATLPDNTEWIAELIPGLDARVDQFTVDTDEVDDELIEVFLSELQRLTGELQDGVVQGDTEIVRAAAHSIKGMGGTIGLPELSVLAMEIENQAKKERLSEATVLIDSLAAWMQKSI